MNKFLPCSGQADRSGRAGEDAVPELFVMPAVGGSSILSDGSRSSSRTTVRASSSDSIGTCRIHRSSSIGAQPIRP